MDSLQALLSAKKKEIAVIQAKKAEKRTKYLCRAEVDFLRYEETLKKTIGSTDHTPPFIESGSHEGFVASKKQKVADKVIEWIDPHAIEVPAEEMNSCRKDSSQPNMVLGESSGDRISRSQQFEHDAAKKSEELYGLQAPDSQCQDEANGLEEEQDIDKGKIAAAQSADTEADADPEKLIYRFFRKMLQLWEHDLAERPEDIKRTMQGKIATKTLKQCKDYIRPLFRLCKERRVPSAILPNLVEIVKSCEEKEFVQANDSYIRLAIGNAAWPIGVTMVGIHERTGREKIHANKQAHVMNNEAQRKYLTSVKRLITYCQSISKVLPSKKVS